ncbi:cyclic nucleotide-binding domain-containing protein [Polyangium spumosum]|uniref:Cyclic nucleotide-binding domain-containing protein n=1 Tax=Polyangium spumosum TaxID=889282 RepID=A0A6N7PUG8_9BACT|nr:cyclic nucleotide-binding domain-containing protein [Polyangium spumosum]MRG93724.1 cyclic nucleotide-binding domain-containing protein [Polyangium spumosum]
METESLARSLAEQPLVAGMLDAHVEFLSGCAQNVRLSAGKFLFREGQRADNLYLIRSGKIALESHDGGRGTLVVETVGAGDALGWSTLFPPYRWGLDARVVEPALVFAIDGTCLRSKLDADHSFGYAFTRRLLNEVHSRLQRARLQTLDVYRAAP